MPIVTLIPTNLPTNIPSILPTYNPSPPPSPPRAQLSSTAMSTNTGSAMTSTELEQAINTNVTDGDGGKSNVIATKSSVGYNTTLDLYSNSGNKDNETISDANIIGIATIVCVALIIIVTVCLAYIFFGRKSKRDADLRAIEEENRLKSIVSDTDMNRDRSIPSKILNVGSKTKGNNFITDRLTGHGQGEVEFAPIGTDDTLALGDDDDDHDGGGVVAERPTQGIYESFDLSFEKLFEDLHVEDEEQETKGRKSTKGKNKTPKARSRTTKSKRKRTDTRKSRAHTNNSTTTKTSIQLQEEKDDNFDNIWIDNDDDDGDNDQNETGEDSDELLYTHQTEGNVTGTDVDDSGVLNDDNGNNINNDDDDDGEDMYDAGDGDLGNVTGLTLMNSIDKDDGDEVKVNGDGSGLAPPVNAARLKKQMSTELMVASRSVLSESGSTDGGNINIIGKNGMGNYDNSYNYDNYTEWSQKDVLIWLKKTLVKNNFENKIIISFLREFGRKYVTGKTLEKFQDNNKFIDEFILQFSDQNQESNIWLVVRNAIEDLESLGDFIQELNTTFCD